MKIEAWKCDTCGKEYKKDGGSTIGFFVGREIDAAGDTDDNYLYSDLCNSCIVALVTQLLQACLMAERVHLAKDWKAR